MFVYAVILLAVLLWMAVTFRARMRVRDCRWRQNRAKDTPSGRYYLCIHCGAETFTADGKDPTGCLRSSQQGK